MINVYEEIVFNVADYYRSLNAFVIEFPSSIPLIHKRKPDILFSEKGRTVACEVVVAAIATKDLVKRAVHLFSICSGVRFYLFGDAVTQQNIDALAEVNVIVYQIWVENDVVRWAKMRSAAFIDNLFCDIELPYISAPVSAESDRPGDVLIGPLRTTGLFEVGDRIWIQYPNSGFTKKGHEGIVQYVGSIVLGYDDVGCDRCSVEPRREMVFLMGSDQGFSVEMWKMQKV